MKLLDVLIFHHKVMHDLLCNPKSAPGRNEVWIIFLTHSKKVNVLICFVLCCVFFSKFFLFLDILQYFIFCKICHDFTLLKFISQLIYYLVK